MSNLSAKLFFICLGLALIMQVAEASSSHNRRDLGERSKGSSEEDDRGYGRVPPPPPYGYPSNIPQTGDRINGNYYYGTPNNANPCLQPYGAAYGWGNGAGVGNYGKRGIQQQSYYPFLGNNQLYYRCIGNQAILFMCGQNYAYSQSSQNCYPVGQGK